MLKRDVLSNPNSCLNKAADDEPIFVLRANDELASRLIREWAAEYSFSKEFNGKHMTLVQRAKYNEALHCAAAMEQWRRERNARSHIYDINSKSCVRCQTPWMGLRDKECVNVANT
jgi:hypothetical protein